MVKQTTRRRKRITRSFANPALLLRINQGKVLRNHSWETSEARGRPVSGAMPAVSVEERAQ
jgi:hypothetical protein